MLTVCASSTETDLTTLEAVQEVLGAPSTDDPLLARLIVRASRWAEGYLGYPLSAAVYAETVPGTGLRCLVLSRTPIRAVTRVLDSTATSGATDYSTQLRIEDADAGLLSRDIGFGWTAAVDQNLARTPMVGQETRPWYVTYEAGYVLEGTTSTVGGTTSTGRTLPDDIEEAVITKVIGLYEGTAGVTSKRVGDLSISYASESQDPAADMLAPYRRIA